MNATRRLFRSEFFKQNPTHAAIGLSRPRHPSIGVGGRATYRLIDFDTVTADHTFGSTTFYTVVRAPRSHFTDILVTALGEQYDAPTHIRVYELIEALYDLPAVRPTVIKIRGLSAWTDGWNGYDAPAPRKEAIDAAIRWTRHFFREVNTGQQPWIAPSVTGGEGGEVVLEWWHEGKTLTVYIDAESAEYVTSWGTDLNAEMADGVIDSADDRRQLWSWLTTP